MTKEAELNAGAGKEGTPEGSPVNEGQSAAAGGIAETADQLKTRLRACLARVQTREELEALIAELPYTVGTMNTVRECIPEKGLERGRVLDLVAGILIHAWDSNPDQAGKMATLLSQTWLGWHPEDMAILRRLEQLCKKAIEQGDVAKIAIVQPTAYVLGALGNKELYREWLQTTTTQAKWREADLERNTKSYYASGNEAPRCNQLAAIERHLGDPNRTGYLRAHDVGLLAQIILQLHAEEKGRNDPEVVRTVTLLRETIGVLEEDEQHDLVKKIRETCSMYL